MENEALPVFRNGVLTGRLFFLLPSFLFPKVFYYISELLYYLLAGGVFGMGEEVSGVGLIMECLAW